MKNLAIIIPAYKPQFLYEALESISFQSCKDFTLYIGDDGSPYDLLPIISQFEGKLDFIYKRFDTNLGSTDLVAHWERCIKLSHDEEWIWLFSDDDRMDDDCVEKFYQATTEHLSELYRFNLKLIDNDGNILNESKYPKFETSADYFLSRNYCKVNSAVTNYIFSRKIYNECNGFVRFPFAWCSDDATWINFGLKSGIRLIEVPTVYWRLSDQNISNNKSDHNLLKMEAQILYLKWIYSIDELHFNPRIFYNRYEFRRITYGWLYNVIGSFIVDYYEVIYLSRLTSEIYQTNFLGEFFWIFARTIVKSDQVYAKILRGVMYSISRRLIKI